MVNIFIIKPDIYETARMLDNKRLGKQRVEAKQIIEILEDYDSGNLESKKAWVNHPATKSWIGFTNHLKVYFNIIVREWINRGFVNNMSLYDIDETPYNIVPCNFDGKTATYDVSKFDSFSFPFWISFPPFYMSHQAALCRKDPKYYKSLLCSKLNPYLEFGYLWPSNVDLNCYTNWNSSYHEDLSSGCPPVYRIPTISVLRWLTNPLINPLSGRKITPKSQIYLDYKSAMNAHEIVVIGDIITIWGNVLCNLNDINSGILLLEQYYSNNGGYPSVTSLCYKFSEK